MELANNRLLSHITDVNPNSGLWTVAVHVVERHRTDTVKRGGRIVTFRRYLLADRRGNKVSAIVYDNDIHYFSASLQPMKRYFISNARLLPAFGFFVVGPYMFSWVITHECPVDLIDEPVVPPLPFSYDVCAFNSFGQFADKQVNINVKGIAVHASPVKQVTEYSTKREIILINESKIPVVLTLWNSFGDIEGTAIANNIANNPIVIGVNVKATTCNGISLATRMFSCILVEPPLTEGPALKEWFNNNKPEIMRMLRDNKCRKPDKLLPYPADDQTIDVPTARATLLTVHTAWVVGKLEFQVMKKKYYMSTCGHCSKKIKAGAGWRIRCSWCGENGAIDFRCRVPLELTGAGESLPIILTSPDVEDLTGLTGLQLRDSREFGFGLETDLQAALDGLHVVCFIKKYDYRSLGTPATPGYRFTAVKTYKRANVLPAPAESAPMDDNKLCTSNNSKQLTEVDGQAEHEKKPRQFNPLAKRALDFISMTEVEKQPATTSMLCREPATVYGVPNELGTPIQSPGKKGKDIQKMG